MYCFMISIREILPEAMIIKKIYACNNMFTKNYFRAFPDLIFRYFNTNFVYKKYCDGECRHNLDICLTANKYD